jgi:DNA-binding transcriptional LysR family regulator
MDRLAAMEAFVRVVDAGSFSGAAKQLRLGQPAVSKTIAQLEDRLGVRLLLRSTHRLMPTEAGRNFYERAKRAIEEADEAELTARGAAVTLSGRLRICGPLTFTRLLVMPRLSTFLTEHPSLDIDVVLEDRDIDLIAASIDVALLIGRLADSAVTARKIGQCQRRVIGAPAYFEASGVPQTPAGPARASGHHLRAARWWRNLGVPARNVRNHHYRERPSSGQCWGGYSGRGARRPWLCDSLRVVVRAGAEIRSGHICAR